MVHSDMPRYPVVLHEERFQGAAARRVLARIGVHPCFCGGSADRGDPAAVVIRPGYLDGHRTTESWTDQGIRDEVGAAHRPLPELSHAFLDAGPTLERFAEGGTPLPIVLAVLARRPR